MQHYLTLALRIFNIVLLCVSAGFIPAVYFKMTKTTVSRQLRMARQFYLASYLLMITTTALVVEGKIRTGTPASFQTILVTAAALSSACGAVLTWRYWTSISHSDDP